MRDGDWEVSYPDDYGSRITLEPSDINGADAAWERRQDALEAERRREAAARGEWVPSLEDRSCTSLVPMYLAQRGHFVTLTPHRSRVFRVELIANHTRAGNTLEDALELLEPGQWDWVTTSDTTWLRALESCRYYTS